MVIGSGPVLPAEATTVIPASQASITAWLMGSSQYQDCGSALNDRFMTLML
jgi:hypothetical protein